jgi:hypothetical protein
VILECDWAGGGVTEQYTVRIVTKAGAEGAPPALTQIDGVLWQDLLWAYTIDDAGVMTDFVDERNMLGLPSPQYSRQGGDADDFSVWGTTHYLTGQLRVQFGVAKLSGGAATHTDVVFPIAFGNKPIVFLQTHELDPDYGLVVPANVAVADFDIDHAAVGSATIYVNWIALGPK